MEAWAGPAMQLLGLILGGGLIAGTMRSTLQHIQGEVREIKQETKKLNEIVTTLALQKQQIEMLDRRYEELRHGEGFVFPLAQKLRETI